MELEILRAGCPPQPRHEGSSPHVGRGSNWDSTDKQMSLGKESKGPSVWKVKVPRYGMESKCPIGWKANVPVPNRAKISPNMLVVKTKVPHCL